MGLLHYLGWLIQRRQPDNLIHLDEYRVHNPDWMRARPDPTVSRVIDLTAPIGPQIDEMLEELHSKEK